MTTQTLIFLAKRYIEDLLQEIPDKINAYVWQPNPDKTVSLVVFRGKEKWELVFLEEELLDGDGWEERVRANVEEWIEREFV